LVLIASMVIVGSAVAVTPVWGAQLNALINPNNELSQFSINYQKTVFIEYPDGGDLYDLLRGKAWDISGTADSSNPGVQELMSKLNQKILGETISTRITDLSVTYDFNLIARETSTSIDYRVLLDGTLGNYVITSDGQRTLVDLGWRALSTNDEINIDGIEINIPLNILRVQEPEVYDFFAGTDAENVLGIPLINADFIGEQPLTNWHFLFDPTGINVDAGTFGLDDAISGFVVSSWTMGESSLREGRQVERVFEADVVADKTYNIRSVQSSDQANLSTIGFGALDKLDGIEIIGVTPTSPEGYATTSTGGFPIMIVYGMAGLAAIAGIAFFIFSNRSLKNETKGQQGIDPANLVGYQTSASSGGYQTNRGEAHLKDDTDYQQTRSVYDESQSLPQTDTVNSSTETTATATPTHEDAACGCAASASMDMECDCEMQSACLCDATCGCNAAICKDQVSSMG
jgi:hypothetical protein